MSKTDFQESIDLLSDCQNFKLFTDILKAKIAGGLVSKIEISNLNTFKNIIDERIILDCPECGDSLQFDIEYSTYECDCGNQIDTRSISFEKRYRMKDSFFDSLKDFFAQSFVYYEKTFVIIFGENKKSYLQHNGNVTLHITPFHVWEDYNEIEVKILDSVYADHFLISWELFSEILVIEKRNKIFKQILKLRKEIIERQIDWEKISPSDFERLSIELLEKEKKFSKITPGGKGPDQGKDGFGYSSIRMPSGREIQLKTLIQCKHTVSRASFNHNKIFSYVLRAKEHSCNSLLFITNGSLSGDAVSAIESGSFYDLNFNDVDFYDSYKLINLLEKHDDIRTAYFYKEAT